ncbi:MAG: hypothetical protein LUE92_15180 [Clostridiales bacterium]|nr:hypothetical protein [Clostridiales bacterium]
MILDENGLETTEIDFLNNPVPSKIKNYIYLLDQIMHDFDSPECEKLYQYLHNGFNDSNFSDIEIPDLGKEADWLTFLAVRRFNYEAMKTMQSHRLIVSFTSYPARIQAVSAVLETIYSQTLQADEVILWLASEQFPQGESELPEDLKNYARDGKLTIRWCDDLKPHKKYFYVMQEYPDDIVVTIDDDILYPPDTLQKLYASYLAFPDAVSTIRAHVITLSEDGKILPYKNWLVEMDQFRYKPSLFLMATGCQGILYPPSLLPALTYDKLAIQETCLYADDLWLKTMELLNKVPTVCASKFQGLRYVPGTQDTALYKENQNRGGNDAQLRQITDYLNSRGMKDIWEHSLAVMDPADNLSSRANICTLTNTRYSAIRGKLSWVEKQSAKFEQSLKKTEAEKKELNAKLTESDKKRKEFFAGITQAKAEKAELLEKLRQANANISDLNTKLDQCNAEKTDINTANKKAESKNKSLAKKLKKANNEKKELDKEILKLQTELTELKEHFLVRLDGKLRSIWCKLSRKP